jgi:hypothetical protein
LSVIATARHLGLNTHQLLRQLCHEGLQRRAITPLPLDQDHPRCQKPPDILYRLGGVNAYVFSGVVWALRCKFKFIVVPVKWMIESSRVGLNPLSTQRVGFAVSHALRITDNSDKVYDHTERDNAAAPGGWERWQMSP